jgi:GMP synthase (glutamine-hydrolysing)
MAGDQAIGILKAGEALPPVRAARRDFEVWIAEGLGVQEDEIRVVSPWSGDPLPDPASLRGVIVTGSPAMVSDCEAWSEASASWLARIVEGDLIPVLGICYGHQLLAHGLGGEVGPNPRGREMGTMEVMRVEGAHEDDLMPDAARFPGHMSHLESVLRPPESAILLARTALEPHAALRFGPRQWGVQFHPEFDRDIMQRYVDARREALLEEGFDPDGISDRAIETPESTGVLARFAALANARD